MAWLASRSACLFRARGTHSYETRPRRRAAALARDASGCSAGCLICQRPDICSTTSLESIRTFNVRAGREVPRGFQPRDEP